MKKILSTLRGTVISPSPSPTASSLVAHERHRMVATTLRWFRAAGTRSAASWWKMPLEEEVAVYVPPAHVGVAPPGRTESSPPCGRAEAERYWQSDSPARRLKGRPESWLNESQGKGCNSWCARTSCTLSWCLEASRAHWGWRLLCRKQRMFYCSKPARLTPKLHQKREPRPSPDAGMDIWT